MYGGLTVNTDISIEDYCKIRCTTDGSTVANIVFSDDHDSLGIVIGVDALRCLVTACSTALAEVDA
jgi:hypothetical protein